MPVITIQMREGRSSAAKKKLLRKVTDAVADSIEVDPARVRVLIHEVPDLNFAVGGISYAEQENGS